MDKPAHPTRCPNCGSNVVADTPGGLCPPCLMAIADAPTVASPGEPSTELPPTRGWRDYVQGSAGPAPGYAFGPYHIVRLIGRGGMGDVYEAEHIEQGRHV